MSAIIVSRTISAIVDKKLVLANDQAARVLGIGTNWNTIRFGMRVCVNNNGDTGDITAPVFQIGMCSGTANKVGDATTTNFFGCGATASPVNWTYNAGGGNPYYANTNFTCVQKRVGTTLTTGGQFAVAGPYMTGAPTVNRNIILIEISKGSPNWGMTGIYVYTNVNVGVDWSYNQLLNAMEAATMVAAKTYLGAPPYDVQGPVNLAFDETAGALNAFNIRWSNASHPMEISEVLYARIA